MRVLVVGGAGYLGGALTDLLSGGKHEVTVYDSLLFEDAYLKNVDFVQGDIRDHAKLKEELKIHDVVVWLAALVGDGACAINPTLTKQINQDSVKWLSENFNGRIIFMSTCSVYGAMDGILDENSPTNPLSVYAATKLVAESYLKGNNALIFRLGTLFGLGDSYSRIRLDLVVNTLTVKAFTDGRLSVFGGEQYRPLLHVRDAAAAILKAIESDKTGIYNLHSENIKISDLATEVAEMLPATIETVDMEFEDLRNYRVNSDKFKKDTGFFTVYPVEAGVRELRAVLQEGRIKDVNNPRYSNQRYLEMFNV